MAGFNPFLSQPTVQPPINQLQASLQQFNAVQPVGAQLDVQPPINSLQAAIQPIAGGIPQPGLTNPFQPAGPQQPGFATGSPLPIAQLAQQPQPLQDAFGSLNVGQQGMFEQLSGQVRQPFGQRQFQGQFRQPGQFQGRFRQPGQFQGRRPGFGREFQRPSGGFNAGRLLRGF